MALDDYNTNPDLNTSISGINIAEGCPPSGINNAIRQIMADLKAKIVLATQAVAGLMSAADKTKLDGIATGANNYVHPTTAGNKHIPAGGSSGQILRWEAAGTAAWGADNNTTYSDFVKSGATAAAGLVPKPPTTAGTKKYLREDGTWQVPPDTNTTYGAATAAALGLVKVGSNITVASGTISLTKQNVTNALGYTPPAQDTNTTYTNFVKATDDAAGKAGLVPAPAKGKQASYLRGDGTWSVPTNTTYSNATESKAGLMSAADKAKLNDIAAGATTKAVSQKAKWNAAADGTWTITGLTVGAPLFIIHEKKSHSGVSSCQIRAVSGCVGAVNTTDWYTLGTRDYASNCMIVIPTAATVKFNVRYAADDGDVLYAYQ